ncbi:phage major capsid protein, HK97 family [Halolactibacillus halophilus]|uniref:Phage major capsid protein, HK97 family n=1 Tax=Halolactibacillus halophilus TaxID=306540 RepID=A0A1I5MLJ1_9BACI|nr:phage major capsid protein [Halolactibacillus halophilus]GEM02503.1 hypothetical protein HHA03_20350 [Halolactibacillus halophilus]SFP10462.1 phage major capsid protein, HK97 family [Halolactibacillus halophilus]
MALKQLMLKRKIDQRNSELEKVLERDKDFKKRSEELEASIEEAQTDEEVEAVEEEVKTLEEEQSENDKEKQRLQDEIKDLETKLDDMEDDEPKNVDETNEERDKKTEGVVRMKVNKGFFKGQERSASEQFVQREEVKTFLTDIREGNVLKESQMKKRAINGADLGIPDVILGLLRDNLHRYSKLISKVNLRAIPGTSRTNIVGDIPEAVWTEACATLNELDLRFYQLEMDGYKVGGFIPVCNATLEDSDFDLANEILDALGQAIGLAVDKAILYGTGTKMPVGIVTRLAETVEPSYWGTNEKGWTDLSTTHVGQVTGADAKEFYANLIRFTGKAKANYGNGSKFWAMNETTYTEIQAKLVEFNAAGAIVSGVNNTLPIINGDVVILPFMADGDIVGGYGSHYILAERAGSSFAQSEHVQFIEDNTVYKGTARYDGRPIFGDGFVAINIDGSAPTTTATFAPDTANTP